MSTSKPWKWVRSLAHAGEAFRLLDGRGRNRATVWTNGTWSTWDEDGVGCQNDCCAKVRDAMDQAIAAVVRQGWTPFKVNYPVYPPNLRSS